jgi:hypothetical protein
MIFNLLSVGFSDNEWIYILSVVFKGWAEMPLSSLSGYSKNNLKFLDGIIGFLLKQTEKTQVEYPDAMNHKFVNLTSL